MKTYRKDKQIKSDDEARKGFRVYKEISANAEAMKTLQADKQIRTSGTAMKALRLKKTDIEKGYLILVNPSHSLKHDLPSERIVSAYPDTIYTLLKHRAFANISDEGIDRTNIILERQTAKMLSKVMNILGCDREIVFVSGYRTMQEQKTIYADSLKDNGAEFTKKYVAIPGCSEHQTGFAVDLAKYSDSIDFIRPSFPYTGIYGHFRDICAQYGFIERYPAGCEHITSIAHEPWHFRYVGYPHSKVMKRKDLTLEEYTDYLRQFSYQRNHLRLELNRHNYEIFYVPIKNKSERELKNKNETKSETKNETKSETKIKTESKIENKSEVKYKSEIEIESKDKTETIIEIPDGIPFQVSGNNVDGVVVTLWRD